MINHIRTLLLDEKGDNKPGDSYPLEEFVPTSFKPARMPFELRKVWNVLFGNKPDRAYKNWRLFQISEVAQASDLAEHWFTFDSRITHFNKPAADHSTEYGTVLASRNKNGQILNLKLVSTAETVSAVQSSDLLNQASSAAELGLSFTGRLTADETLGRCYSVWVLELNNADELGLNNLSDASANEVQALSFSQGLSQAVSLKGSGLSLKFGDQGPASWTLETVARPSKDMGTIVANLDNLPRYELEVLFAGKRKELGVFKDYWFKNDNLAERVTALVLALAFKIEEKRDV
jgi:hypothetical protein